MRKIFLSILLFLLVFSASAEENKRPYVIWLNSTFQHETEYQSPFWYKVEDFMSASAEDLGVELKVVKYSENAGILFKLIKNILESDKKPDMIIFHNHKHTAEQVLRMTETAGIKTFIFNSAPHEKSTGMPREKYKYWIGLMTPDDERTGYDLMSVLINEAYKLNKFRKAASIKTVAIAGLKVSTASVDRVHGLNRYLKTDSAVKLQQIFYTDWRSEWTQKITLPLLKRYPETGIVWTVSDLIADTFVKNAEMSGYVAGVDFVAGGVDWMPETMENIKNKKIAVSIGGHFFEGAFVMIAVYDYINGNDFQEIENLHFRTEMFPLTYSEYKDFGSVIKKLNKENIRKLDFRKFSKTYNRGIEKYNFSVKKLLNEYKKILGD